MQTQNIEKVLASLGVRISKEKLAEVQHHPKQGSIECLSDYLDALYINHLIVSLKPQQFDRIPYPAIAHCQESEFEDGYFVVLRQANSEQVQYYHPDRGEVSESLQLFQKVWDGTVLVLEITEESGERDYEEAKKRDLWKKSAFYIPVFVFLLVCLVAAVVFATSGEWALSVLLIPLLAGSIVSFLIVRKEFGKNDKWSQRLCTLGMGRSIEKENSCDILISSKASKLFGWLPLGELGMVYFFVQLLLYITFIWVGHSYPYTAIFVLFAAAAIPMVVFSIIYQIAVKTWCTLCLLIQAFVLIELALLYFGNPEFIFFGDVGLGDFVLPAFLVVVAIALWVPLKYGMQRELVHSEAKKGLFDFKYNAALFYAHLVSYERKDMIPLPNDIVLGDPNAPITMTMYSNPFCEPCTELYPEVFALLDYYGEELNVCLRFLPGKKAGDDKVVSHLLQISASANIREAIETWYATKEYDPWAQQYPKEDFPKTTNHLNGDEALKIHKEWATSENIRHTPIFYINGYLLRAPYKLTDLQQHIRFAANKFAGG